MNKRRLLKLADLLEADAKNKKGIKFDLGVWGEMDNEKRPVSCGTTACAMGLAVASGAFIRNGLRRYDEDSFLIPKMKSGKQGFDAAAELFGINGFEALWLFSDDFYDGPVTGKHGELKVAKRIRDFVSGKEQP